MGAVLGLVALTLGGCGSGESDSSVSDLVDPTCVTAYSCDNSLLTVCTDSSTEQESAPISCDGSLNQGPACLHSSDIVGGC